MLESEGYPGTEEGTDDGGFELSTFGSVTGERTLMRVRSFSGWRVRVALDVKAEGDGAQRLRQLLPQQNLFQLGGSPVLLEEVKDLFLLPLVG